MNTDTPETNHAAFTAIRIDGDGVPTEFARKLERERDEARKRADTMFSKHADILDQARRERDEWKARYIQQNKDLGCELMDPNGTIWDHAQTLQRERDEARKIIAAVLSILPVGHIPSHTPESIPDRIRELVDSWISLERERDEWRN